MSATILCLYNGHKTEIKPVEEIFPDWYISFSFGKSTSKQLNQAIALAKAAPLYFETVNEGKVIYQAVYSSKPQDYLDFIKLYELAKAWKSSFVIINGEIVDRKIVGKLNYCYGDFCRSANPEYCFGASPLTENPFGCHRLQISEYNNPWYSFGELDEHNIWHVNKEEIRQRINLKESFTRYCPRYNHQSVFANLEVLPSTIDLNNNSEFEFTGTHLIHPLQIKVSFSSDKNEFDDTNDLLIKDDPININATLGETYKEEIKNNKPAQVQRKEKDTLNIVTSQRQTPQEASEKSHRLLYIFSLLLGLLFLIACFIWPNFFFNGILLSLWFIFFSILLIIIGIVGIICNK